MRLDRAFDDVEPGCDLRVGEPRSHESDHVALAVGQALHSSACRGLPAQPATHVEASDDAASYLRREVRAPGRNGPDASDQLARIA
jgi:hypothetical protein